MGYIHPSIPKRWAWAISRASRRRKYDLFQSYCHPTALTTVLDVGPSNSAPFAEGTPLNFLEAFYPYPDRLTVVAPHSLDRLQASLPAIRPVFADGRALPFPDASFDVVFSNAVVEHVGQEADQRRFVAECCRVGRTVFLTTPNRRFPIETHTLLPAIHWLPTSAEARVLQWCGHRLPPYVLSCPYRSYTFAKSRSLT